MYIIASVYNIYDKKNFLQGFSPASNQAVIVQPTQSAPYSVKDELDEDEIDWEKLL